MIRSYFVAQPFAKRRALVCINFRVSSTRWPTSSTIISSADCPIPDTWSSRQGLNAPLLAWTQSPAQPWLPKQCGCANVRSSLGTFSTTRSARWQIRRDAVWPLREVDRNEIEERHFRPFAGKFLLCRHDTPPQVITACSASEHTGSRLGCRSKMISNKLLH